MNTSSTTSNELPFIAQYFDTVKPNPAKSWSYVKNLVQLQPILATPCGQHGNPPLLTQLLALPADIRINSLELDDALMLRHRLVISAIEALKPQLHRYGAVPKKIINVPAHVDSFGVHIEAKEQACYMLLPEQIVHLFLNMTSEEATLAFQFSLVRELFQI
jgi:hypothetical protein